MAEFDRDWQKVARPPLANKRSCQHHPNQFTFVLRCPDCEEEKLAAARREERELRTELAEARKDGERLDWLEKMQGWQARQASTYRVALEVSGKQNPTYRDAIDDAMEGEG